MYMPANPAPTTITSKSTAPLECRSLSGSGMLPPVRLGGLYPFIARTDRSTRARIPDRPRPRAAGAPPIPRALRPCRRARSAVRFPHRSHRRGDRRTLSGRAAHRRRATAMRPFPALRCGDLGCRGRDRSRPRIRAEVCAAPNFSMPGRWRYADPMETPPANLPHTTDGTRAVQARLQAGLTTGIETPVLLRAAAGLHRGPIGPSIEDIVRQRQKGFQDAGGARPLRVFEYCRASGIRLAERQEAGGLRRHE